MVPLGGLPGSLSDAKTKVIFEISMSLEFEGSVQNEHGHFSLFGRKGLYAHAAFALAHQSPMIDLNFVLASGALMSEIVLCS